MFKSLLNLFNNPKVEIKCSKCDNAFLATKGEVITNKIILCDDCMDHLIKKLERRKK